MKTANVRYGDNNYEHCNKDGNHLLRPKSLEMLIQYQWEGITPLRYLHKGGGKNSHPEVLSGGESPSES